MRKKSLVALRKCIVKQLKTYLSIFKLYSNNFWLTCLTCMVCCIHVIKVVRQPNYFHWIDPKADSVYESLCLPIQSKVPMSGSSVYKFLCPPVCQYFLLLCQGWWWSSANSSLNYYFIEKLLYTYRSKTILPCSAIVGNTSTCDMTGFEASGG